jgi:hypothetical protein
MIKIIVATLMVATSLTTYAGSPRCVGNPDQVSCEQLEAVLASETAAQKAERIERLEKNRQITSAQVIRQPLVRKNNRGIAIGMSQSEVIASIWGKPQSVNRTTNSFGVHEQWVYGGNNYLYFDNGFLTTIQN